MKRKFLIVWILLLPLAFSSGTTCLASADYPNQDSRELQYQDMLMLFLLPYIEERLPDIYEPLLTVTPMLYPYMAEVVEVRRANGFRGYSFICTIEVVPTVGPHIPVGKDRFTFEISVKNVKVIGIQHLKDPDKDHFPPNYADVLR
ncbi:DUF3888 domain-containing protein [Paenibacillus sp. VMFN-D1]|uniref:DUF3888 domain-containing protein n=1 Tax=Paenibacillus sp. VMFN-D1 TaxID=2135608 RepID=UPI000E37E085|nr:DUF3888 domain-containing protein [Paenibacillus sp. VMFN-D1]RED41787.1 uncharacterized protein DUF3888 [Paenibacillus sp. VMFN-D1]